MDEDKIRMESIRLAIQSFGKDGVRVHIGDEMLLRERADKFYNYITTGYFQQ